jgi:acyl-CoA thioesterase-1
MKTFLITLSILLLSTSSSIAYSSTGAAISPTESTNIMVYGDSLSAGYGLPQRTGWVSMLKTQLKTQQSVYQIINASISGETTLGGLNRIEQALKRYRPSIVIVELGANDGLRGLPIKSIHDNLEDIVKACKQSKASILLVGMRLPPNYGATYTKKFSAIYQQIAKRHELRLVPFLLAGFGDNPEYFQEDKMHPNENAQEKILTNVWKVLHKMIMSN